MPLFNSVVELADAYMQLTVPSFEFPRDVIPPSVHFVGTPPIIPNQAPLPPWAHELDGSRKVVLVTQGTVANHNFGLLIAPDPRGTCKRARRARRRHRRRPPGRGDTRPNSLQRAARELFAVRMVAAEGRRVRHQWRLWQRQPGHELWNPARHGRADGRQGRRQCARRMVRRRHRSRNQRADAGGAARSRSGPCSTNPAIACALRKWPTSSPRSTHDPRSLGSSIKSPSMSRPELSCNAAAQWSLREVGAPPANDAPDQH